MGMSGRQRILALSGLAILLFACALPNTSAPTPFVFPTANLTMTALFDPNAGVPPTATPSAVPSASALPATATAPPSQPSATALPPTATVAQPTATAIPPSPTVVLWPTATAAPPTATTVPPTPVPPTATTVPAVRPGPVVKAPLLWVAPNRIDANLGDWRTKTEYPIQSVVFGANNYTGASDLSGKFRIGWDYRALYLAVIVVDDKLVQTQHGAQMYKGDDVEIQLDLDYYGDFYVSQCNGDDFQIGLSPGVPPGTAPEAYLWCPRGKARTLPEVEVAVHLTANGYIMEAAIPWSVFGRKPEPGTRMGFALNLSDNDAAGQAIQQTMLSNDPFRRLLDPTTWGTLVFFDPRK